jgi:hypothetical protein
MPNKNNISRMEKYCDGGGGEHRILDRKKENIKKQEIEDGGSRKIAQNADKIFFLQLTIILN